MCCVAFSFWQVYTGMQAAGAESSQQEDDSLDFPNAIYIDGIDVDGGLHTGVAHPCGKGADCSTSLPVPSASSAPNANASYAYSATVVRSLSGKTRRYCGIMCDILMECRSFAKTGSGQLKGKPTNLWFVLSAGRGELQAILRRRQQQQQRRRRTTTWV